MASCRRPAAHMALTRVPSAGRTRRRLVPGFRWSRPGVRRGSGIRLNASGRFRRSLPDKGITRGMRLRDSLRLRRVPARLAARGRHRLDHSGIPSGRGGNSGSVHLNQRWLCRGHAITVHVITLLRIVHDRRTAPRYVGTLRSWRGRHRGLTAGSGRRAHRFPLKALAPSRGQRHRRAC